MSRGRERSGITPTAGPQGAFTVKVNGRPVTVDTRTLTMVERRKVRAALKAVDALDDEMEAIAGTIWVVMLRDDPSLTYDEVAGAITMENLTAIEDADEASADPN